MGYEGVLIGNRLPVNRSKAALNLSLVVLSPSFTDAR